MEFKHKSVLLEETVGNLKVKPDGIYVDGTLGGGGHSYRICQQLSAKGSLIGIDQDEAAIRAAGERLQEFREQVTIIRSNYCNMKKELQKIGITSVDGIILDLGVISPTSWIIVSGDLRTGRMSLLTCVWISGIRGQQRYCKYVYRTGVVPDYPRLWRR